MTTHFSTLTTHLVVFPRQGKRGGHPPHGSSKEKTNGRKGRKKEREIEETNQLKKEDGLYTHLPGVSAKLGAKVFGNVWICNCKYTDLFLGQRPFVVAWKRTLKGQNV